MVRLVPLSALTLMASVAFMAAGAVTADEALPSAQQQTPIQRGYGQHDACFGDKYERDEDLKTGNEREIEEILKLLLNPGS